jgi:transposase InsO family protein
LSASPAADKDAEIKRLRAQVAELHVEKGDPAQHSSVLSPRRWTGDPPLPVDLHPPPGLRRAAADPTVGRARSGFYRWPATEPHQIARAAADAALAAEITAIHTRSGGAYRAPRVTVELPAATGRATGPEARQQLFRWIAFYNHRRRPSATGYLSPADDETSLASTTVEDLAV